MKDRDAFALGAAVDNLIKITAGENGCRYSHALTACNMLPVSMGASCQDIFISKIQMPDRDNRNADFYFPNCVRVGSSKKENISLEESLDVTISFRTSFRRSFANVAKKKKKIGARSYLVASLYTNFCRRPIRQGPHHVCKCTSIGPCFTTNHP